MWNEIERSKLQERGDKEERGQETQREWEDHERKHKLTSGRSRRSET